MKDATFKSSFAVLDVKSGRKALAARIAAGEKVRVRIDMVLDTQHSGDDGTSIEFTGHVSSVKQFKAPLRARAPKRSGHSV